MHDNPAWPSWSSADARLAKLCLYGVTPLPPTPSFGGPGGGSKMKMIFGRFPHGREGLGHVFLGKHHQHNWAFVSHIWPPQHNQGLGMVLKPHICGVKKEIRGPNRPHDAHDAGCWGAAGHFNQQNVQNTRCEQCLWL